MGNAISAESNIELRVYNTDEDALADHNVREVYHFSNITCVGLHSYIPLLLDFRNEYDRVVDHADLIAFGDDASAFAENDETLNNRIGEISLTDPESLGTQWRCSELLGQLELNGENIRELGVVSESGRLWNHAALPTPLEPKTTDDAVVINIAINFGAT